MDDVREAVAKLIAGGKVDERNSSEGCDFRNRGIPVQMRANSSLFQSRRKRTTGEEGNRDKVRRGVREF